MRHNSYNRWVSCLLICLSIAIFGCSSSDSLVVENTPLSPGTFVGTWTQEFTISGDITLGVMNCTTVVTKVDSTIQATVMNDSTKEFLFLSGRQGHLEDQNPVGPPEPQYTFYDVRDSSSFFGRVDTAAGFWDIGGFDFHFSSDADTLKYDISRADHLITIICSRK
jgi:hypothetical protein